IDETAPIFSAVPVDLTVACNNIPNPTTPQATDNCDENFSIDFSEVLTPTSCLNNYTLTRTWIATDACGNASTAVQTILVEDTTDPILIGVPSDLVVDASNGEIVPEVPNVLVTDNCDTNVDLNFNETETTTACGAELVRVWTATDNCGNVAMQSQTITVLNANLTVTISPENPEICAGTFVQLMAQPAGGDYTYTWSATGGTFDQIDIANPVYSMMTPGVYTITLVVSGLDGCMETANTTVTVTEEGLGSAGVNSNICEGDAIELIASGGSIYFWNGPNGFSSTQQNPIIINASSANSGTYTVNIGGGNCTGIVEVEVAVAPGLSGDFNKVDATCDALGTINIGVFGGLGTYTYDWLDLPGTDNGEDRTDLTPGLYTVMVTDVGGCTLTLDNIEIVDACSCTADPGGLSPNAGNTCLVDGTASLSATPDGNATIPPGFTTVYVLSSGNDLVLEQMGPFPNFTIDAVGAYRIHTLVYDPNTLDLMVIQLGTSTGSTVNSLLQQGGGEICAALDLSGAVFVIEQVQASLSSQSPEVCGQMNGSALWTPNDLTYQWS
ncbi:MAG: hypothetical protein AAGD05_17240, partial [Bacteroidota bacterium]